MLVLVDTNVLLRIAEAAHSQHQKAVAAVSALRQSGNDVCVVPQIHYEFWVVATRPVAARGLGMTIDEVQEQLIEWSPPYFRFFRDERAIYDQWYELVRRYGVQGKQAHDARLVAAMQRHGLTQILTFNLGDFGRYAGIGVLDPEQVATT